MKRIIDASWPDPLQELSSCPPSIMTVYVSKAFIWQDGEVNARENIFLRTWAASRD